MDELEAELSAVFRQESTAHWVRLLADEVGIPAGPVNDVVDALENEQTRARGTITELDHPVLGPIEAIDHPLNVANARSGFSEASPMLGTDTGAVFREIGHDDEGLAALREAGMIPSE